MLRSLVGSEMCIRDRYGVTTSDMLHSLLTLVFAVAVAADVPTTEISPGVHMPMVNFGICNHTLWLQSGGRGLDTALVYGDAAQAEVGSAISASGLPRSSVFVTTKIPCCPSLQWEAYNNNSNATCATVPSNSSADIAHDLRTLGLEYVDLMLMHWPCDRFEDTLATYQVMEGMVAAGQARAIGVSNFNAPLIDRLVRHARVKPAVNQCGLSVADHTMTPEWGRDDATVEMCKRHNVTFQAYSPLGGWALGGTGHVLNDPSVKTIAAAHNKSSAQVALKWLVQQGIVVVTSSDKLAYDVSDQQLWDFTLTEGEMARLAAVK
eukprot:TRINITY_DN6259_c0_g1_i5.p1 TRINITY_DN6259_c0_g1~~TRINITY_DN6259_c0_g1_i5.p1  ORF type:complete len:352 (+),score=86.44 TRINITY_DN6259_c0_g1_i5:95-1057(+)